MNSARGDGHRRHSVSFRQPDLESGAASRRVAGRNGPAVPFDNRTHDRQTEPAARWQHRPGPRHVHLVEAIEYSWEMLRGDSWTRVLDGQKHTICLLAG